MHTLFSFCYVVINRKPNRLFEQDYLLNNSKVNLKPKVSNCPLIVLTKAPTSKYMCTDAITQLDIWIKMWHEQDTTIQALLLD